MPSAADRGRSAVLLIAPVVFLAGALAEVHGDVIPPATGKENLVDHLLRIA